MIGPTTPADNQLRHGTAFPIGVPSSLWNAYLPLCALCASQDLPRAYNSPIGVVGAGCGIVFFFLCFICALPSVPGMK